MYLVLSYLLPCHNDSRLKVENFRKADPDYGARIAKLLNL